MTKTWASAGDAVKPLPTQGPEQPGHQNQLQEDSDKLLPSWFLWSHGFPWVTQAALTPEAQGESLTWGESCTPVSWLGWDPLRGLVDLKDCFIFHPQAPIVFKCVLGACAASMSHFHSIGQ